MGKKFDFDCCGRVEIEIVKLRIPKTIICPACRINKDSGKKEHWKMVKDVNATVLLRVRVVVYAKCLNPDCGVGSFALPIGGKDLHRDLIKTEAGSAVVKGKNF